MKPYQNPSLPTEERIEDLLSRMTPEEKVAQMDMIRGVELATRVHEAHFCSVDPESDFQWDKVKESIGNRGMGFVHDVYSHAKVLNRLQKYFVEETRLGIPCIFTGEALHGISFPGATCFPMPIALGATFDPEVTHEVGHAIARETRCLGIDEILAPNLDLAREIRWGRVEETFGEDTYLSSQMAYAIITGEQNHGKVDAPDAIVCEPKHYVGHGVPEGGTNCSPLHAGEREIESCYLPVFEAGVRKAGAYNAMAAYHSIDAEPVISSDYYLREVLKKRFGLRGYVRADFGAVNRLQHAHHMTDSAEESIALAVNGGLDVQGFDFPNAVWQGSLLKLLREGRVRMDTVDEAVRRILRVKFDLGLFEHPYVEEGREEKVLRCPEHKAVSLRAAREAVTLLQNRNRVLPLSKDTKKIALLGPSSSAQRLGSYSSVPYGYTVPSLADELRAALPNAEIRQCSGCGITPNDMDILPPSWYPEGVEMIYYRDADFTDEAGRENLRYINFSWILAKPHRDLPFNGYSVRMRGVLRPVMKDLGLPDEYTGRLAFTGDDSTEVRFGRGGDAVTVMDTLHKEAQKPKCITHTFRDGEEIPFDIALRHDGSGHNLTFSIDCHGENIEKAVEIAGESDVAILVCGDDKVTSGEGMDRSDIKLYGKQCELIRRVSETGTPVVLILQTGKPVDLSEEVKLADGILEAWFIGEHGARAIADVLLGDFCPAGRLPISFPRSMGATPAYYTRLPGGSDWYLEGHRRALFPFGHGLSYTTFAYSDLTAEPNEDPDEPDYTVSVTVQNTGTFEADEVVQFYLRDVCSSVVTPDERLVGFKRVHLMPGEKTRVSCRLDYESFRLFNRSRQWVVEPGTFEIAAAASSADLRGSVTVTLHPRQAAEK